MAINERLIDTEVASAGNGGAGTGNQEEGLILHLDANDVDSYDGDGSEWVDITNHEYTPATDVSEHFNTVLYTGNGTTNQITGVDFQPDLIWVKRRNSAANHYIVDTRGNGTSTYKNLSSNKTDAEGTTTTSGITNNTIVDGGFTMQGTGARTNANGSTYVAWCFKAGGAAVSNTDGSITSQVSANQDLGFSIVKHTGTSSNTDIGHGLGVSPELVITKNTTDASNWSVSGSVGGLIYGTNKLQLNLTNGIANDYNEIRSVSSTTISPGTSGATNGSGDDIIHYCFASKRGVSKVGSYVGTGAAGNKVVTGFEPAFLMVKRSSTTGSWTIVDNKRPLNKYLKADDSGSEFTATTGIIFERDGFSFEGGSFNQSSQTSIYYAVAKNTNETSLIPDTDLELHLDAASFPEKGESGYSNTPSTWTDSSSNSNNGTITSATFDSELGNWLDFDGSASRINISSNFGGITNIQATSMWFKTTSTSLGMLFSVGANSSQYGGMYIYIDGSGIIKGGYLGNTGGFLNNSAVSSSSGYNDGNWHHLVLVLTGTYASNQNPTLYIDGNDVGTIISSSSTTQGTVNNASAIGYYPQGNRFYFNGQIGQVRVYSSALTQEQIRQNFNFTKNNYPNGFDGDINGATWNSAGYFNFDGNGDYISLNQGNNMSGSFFNNFSISYWVKLDTTSTLGRHFYAHSSSSNYILLYYNHSLGGMRLGGSNINTQQASYTMSADTWYHIVVTQSSENISLYVNTSRKINSNQSIGIYDDMKVTLGAADQSGSITDSLDGKISKFKLYDKILTTTEIDTLYNEGA